MVSIKMNYLILMIVFLICAGYCVLFYNTQTESGQPGKYYTPLGEVLINAELPESPSEMMLYRVTPLKNDMILYSAGNSVKVRSQLISEAEAPDVSVNALLPYGGLPKDAKLGYAKINFIERFDPGTGQVTAKYPTTINVQYFRVIDKKPVVGDGGFIYIDLGDNGELVFLNKVWRTVSPVGTVPIINASVAIEKIKQGELLGHRPKCSCQMTVDKIEAGYYEKNRDEIQEYLEPVWVFSGNLSSGDSWKYYVYARESLNDSITYRSVDYREITTDQNLSTTSLNNGSERTGLKITTVQTGEMS